MNKYTHEEKQKALEIRAFEPIMQQLGINADKVDFSQERPDIRINYNGKKIGIEVIECYPKSFNKDRFSIENLYYEIEYFLMQKRIFGYYQIRFADGIFKVNKIKTIKNNIFTEVEGLINGTITIEHCKYIAEINKSQYYFGKNTVIRPLENMMNMIGVPSLSDIEECINKKNKLYDTYDKTLEEIWLLIYIPTNMNYYSSNGIPFISKIETKFRRIYVSDYYYRGRLIYEQNKKL